MQPENRPAIARNPDFSALFEAGGISPSAVTQAIEQAAGDHARTAQFTERASGDRRDIAQGAMNRETCAKLNEVVALVDQNNAGPE